MLFWYVDILFCKMYILYPYSPWNCVNYVEDPWTEAERRYDLPYYTTCKESFFFIRSLQYLDRGFLCVFLVFFCSMVCLRFHQRFS
jgi:hypothetical protein